MKASAAMKKLANLELKISALYEYFSENCNDDPEVKDFFKKLSKEEKQHYQIIRFQLRILRQNSNLNQELTLDLGEVDKIHNYIDERLQSRPEISVDNILSMAYQIENQAAEEHYRNAFKQLNKGVDGLLQSLAGYDDQHKNSIQQVATDRDITITVN